MSIPSNKRSVKPRRYDSKRRRAQAAQTRQDVLKASLDTFMERGDTGTTMNAVASAAAVAVETIYRAFGSKAALFNAVVEAANAGGAPPVEVPGAQRSAVR